jgi:hypothetical protein
VGPGLKPWGVLDLVSGGYCQDCATAVQPQHGGNNITTHRAQLLSLPSSIPGGRRHLLAGGEPEAVAALKRSLQKRIHAAVGPAATDAERMWEKLEGLMSRFCDGDIGAAVVKGAGCYSQRWIGWRGTLLGW